MNHADERSLRTRPASAVESGPLPALGGWVFVPTGLADEVIDCWHIDELLSPASCEPTRAERVVRCSRRGLSGVELLVRGVVLHGDAVPLVLSCWHRAVRR